MKATAIAPANIAFIKYWGKVNPATRLPNNNSISMNLSEMYTTTTVEFSPQLRQDDITFLNEEIIKQKEKDRIVWAFNSIRSKAKINLFARVVTKNTFPKATGIAS
ncbi:diphosphomevalonate decarboxylase, partial [Candidatus Gottesmanbacteria bacterium]|nr:diphosphomevalonate decarboxylase [Candidatus Gottesmanbacteria bacterium]